jgi:DNA-binding Xre family transcriptional regulator
MLSTAPKNQRKKHRFVSSLGVLLKERGKTQKQLAQEADLTPSRVNRLIRKRSVHTIVANTALKVCLALSSWPRVKDGKIVTVTLDALYPIRRR